MFEHGPKRSAFVSNAVLTDLELGLFKYGLVSSSFVSNAILTYLHLFSSNVDLRWPMIGLFCTRTLEGLHVEIKRSFDNVVFGIQTKLVGLGLNDFFLLSSLVWFGGKKNDDGFGGG